MSHWANAQATTWTFNGNGNWNVAANWNTGVPNATTDAIIDDGDTAVNVTVTASANTRDLTLGANDTVGINNNVQLIVNGGSFTNSGTISINSTSGNLTDLLVSGNSTLSGGGTISLTASNNSRLGATIAGVRLTNVNNVISGRGQIGLNGLAFTNQAGGLIDANIATSGATLFIDPVATATDAGPAFANQGTMQASNGGTLVLTSGEFTNTGGTIQALTGSEVQVIGSASIIGGTLTTAGTGVIRVNNSDVASISNLTNAGLFVLNNNATLHTTGTINNTGTINVNSSSGNLTDLRIDAPTTFTGGGTILLNATNQSRITANVSGVRVTNSNNVIQGRGQISVNGLAFTNQAGGLIDANNATVGASLTIDPVGVTLDAGPAFDNQGIMQASGGGLLILTSGEFTNTGTIQALAGSEVQLIGSANITGGTLTTAGTGVIRVTNSENGFITNLTNAGNIVVNNDGDLHTTGSIVNSGTITVNSSSGNLTDLRINADTTLSGAGTVSLITTNNARIAASASGLRLTNANNKIQGRGQIGVNGLAVTNASAGLIDANISGQTLLVDPVSAANDAGAVMLNQGTMQASGGGILVLTGNGGGGFTNQNIIQALDTSEVRVTTGARITGGVLQTAGSGFFHLDDTDGAVLVNLTNAGRFEVDNNAALQINGAINNTGSITLSSVANNTDLYLEASSTLSGGGTIILSNNNNVRVNGAGGERLTNNNNTIQGRGQIGVGNLAVTNQGMIDANSNGNTLVLDPVAAANDAGLSFSNTGTLQASGGGILVLTGVNGGIFTNSNIIQALNGSEVRVTNGASISSGTLQTLGTGTFHLDDSDTAAISNLNHAGNFQVDNNAALQTNGIINNTGSITMVAAGNNTDLRIATDTTLNGSGTVLLLNGSTARITASTSGLRLTNTNNTLQGRGQIGVNGLAITNQGLINANIGGATLIIDPAPTALDLGAVLSNQGTLQASGGGILVLSGNGGGSFSNGNIIQALNASEVRVESGASIVGGTLQTAGTGFFHLDDSDSASLTNLTTAGAFQVDNNSVLNIAGTINNTGSITISSAGNNTDLRINGDTTLTGGGTVLLLTAAPSRFTAAVAGQRLTNSGNTIEGRGQVGVDGMAITNEGVVHANIGGQVLTVDPANVANGFFNNTTGTVRASNTSVMNLSGNNGGAGLGQFTNSGIFEVLNGSVLQTVNSGILTNESGGVLSGGTYRSVAAANQNLMHFISNSAVTQIGANTTVELNGQFARIQFAIATPLATSLVTNNGTLKIIDTHTFTATNALANGAGPANTAILQLGGGTFNAPGLTNQTNSTITGFGRIIPRPTNHGTIRAGGGALVFNNGIQGGSGTVEILGGSHLDISPGASDSSGDYLLLNSGGSLTLGTNDFLVGVDYVNGNAGSGNSFNPRANVNGAGQILATPAVQQTVSANVTNGTTTTPTMAMGNIRVGSVSVQSYQINNVGATGPLLRGAIQTNNAAGNNGNVTDPRLTGAGVTAANFGPIANNGSTSSNTVTFTGLTAGPLSGQQVAIVNNFDNVAEQLLTITGAAYNPAVPNVLPGGINFGNFHVGDVVPAQAITISNFATGGAFSEDLRAENITPSGAAQLTGPGAVNVLAGSGTTVVGASMSTASAGPKTGAIGMNLFSNATVNGVAIPGISSLSLGNATVNITGAVYRLAAALVPTPLNLGEYHVGSIAQGSMVVSNTNPGDGFTENLLAQRTSSSGDVVAGSGSATIAGGANSGNALIAQLNTGTAGPRSGIASISLTSLAGGPGLSNTNLGTASVTVNATVFNLAQLQINNPSINFGIVHVGDVVPNVALSITNNATLNFSEKLNTSFGPATVGVVHNAGSISLLNPQANNNTNMSVGIATGIKAVINGTAPVNAQSDGTGVNSLGQTNLPSQNVTVIGQVNDYADPVISKLLGSGVFSTTGVDQYLLDFGTVMVGDTVGAELQLANVVTNPADSLGGSWLNTGAAYLYGGFSTFNNLAPGATIGGLDVDLDTSSPGTFTGSITLTPRSQNAGGYDQLLGGTVVVDITGTVEVPEPALVLPMLAAGMLFRRRRRMA